VLQSVAECCRVLQWETHNKENQAPGKDRKCCSVLQCVAVCCKVLQCAAVCSGALQWEAHNKENKAHGRDVSVAVCCSMLQRATLCCSV